MFKLIKMYMKYVIVFVLTIIIGIGFYFYQSGAIGYIPDAKYEIEYMNNINSNELSAIHVDENKVPTLFDKIYIKAVTFVSNRTKNALKIQESRTKRIDIFGKITDQEGVPVSGALIQAEVDYYPFIPKPDLTWTSRSMSLVSDVNGEFVFHDIEGVSFSIRKISKSGFIFPDKSGRLFMLKNMHSSQLDKLSSLKSPLVFKAWKLSNSGTIVYNKMKFYIEPDRQTHSIDIKNKSIKKENVGLLKVSAYRENSTGIDYVSPWGIKIIAPNGGIAEAVDNFNYLAPEAGYMSEWSFDSSNVEGDTIYELINKKFYIFDDDKKRYGLISLTVHPFFGYDHDKFQVIIEYGFNEPNVRYLEPSIN